MDGSTELSNERAIRRVGKEWMAFFGVIANNVVEFVSPTHELWREARWFSASVLKGPGGSSPTLESGCAIASNAPVTRVAMRVGCAENLTHLALREVAQKGGKQGPLSAFLFLLSFLLASVR